MRYTAIAAVEIATMLTGAVIAVVLAWYGARYWSIVLSQLTAEAAFAAGVWTLSGWRPGAPARASGVRSMLVFGGNLTGARVLGYGSRALDKLLIGRVWGAHQLGLYSRAYQLLLLPLDQINAPIAAIAIPALSRLADSPERYRQAYLRIVEKLAMITMPMAVLLIATSDWLVLIILGPQWSEVSTIFAWLGLAGLIEPIAGTAGWLFISQGRTQEQFRWWCIGGTLTMISIVLGLPWGAVGVAASYSLTGLFLTTPLLLFFVTRTGPVRTADVYRTITPSACASLAALVVLVFLRGLVEFHSPWMGLIAATSIEILTVTLVLSALPSGRSALVDLWRTVASSVTTAKRQSRA
jgi:O-antigen/teichoic acid export membrane protein